MGGLYLNLLFVILFSSVILFAFLLNKKLKYVIFKISIIIIYFIVNIMNFINFVNDVNEYDRFNKEVFSEKTKIQVNGILIDSKISEPLFTVLKLDSFSWVNHPSLKKEYEIVIFTNNSNYKFIIWDTYNQGILVKRLDSFGNEYVTNRNEGLRVFLDNINKQNQH